MTMKHDPFHRAEKALMSLEQRSRYDEQNRLALLACHGLIGVVVGMLMVQFGPPSAWAMAVGQGKDNWLALPAIGGGVLLLSALFLFERNILMEAIGMLAILLWDGLMIYSLYRFGDNPYAVGVYAGMAALMFVHVITLGQYLWSQWRGRLNA